MSNQRHSQHWPQTHPKQATFSQATTKTQQSAVMSLYRHQQDTIILSPPTPWQRCDVVGHCCHCPVPKTRMWHQQHRGSVVHAKSQQTTLPPMSLMHLEHDIGEEGGGGDVGEAMVQKKGECMGSN
eukprot:9630533-Ditylum_brightwellii.AAC.1